MVMDATSQAEEMIKSWGEIQHKMWSHWQDLWLASLKEGGVAGTAESAADSSEQARRVLEAWDNTVRRALEAQLEWTRIWTERVAESSNVPPQIVTAARQLHESAKAWTGFQTKLWEGWLNAASSPGFTGVEAFQRTAQTLAEAQAEWLRQWTGRTQQQASESSGRRTRKSSE
jgi:hypothetical protein